MNAVLFDLDGVLIDSYEVWFRLLNATARAFGTDPILRDTFHACWGQGVAADVERFFPGRSIAETESHYHAHFMDFGDHLYVDPAASPVLSTLRAASLEVALITNTPADLARKILVRAQLEIPTIVGGTDVEHAKPAPDMVHAACRKLSVSPESTIVVGDSRYDAEAAAGAGALFVGFKRDGDARIDSLEELPALLGRASIREAP